MFVLYASWAQPGLIQASIAGNVIKAQCLLMNHEDVNCVVSSHYLFYIQISSLQTTWCVDSANAK